MDEQEAETTVYHALEIKDLSIIADIKATNPGFSTHTHEYMENCQRCVVAYEVRRRGYHVIAKPRILSRTDPQTGSLDAAWYFHYINPHSVAIMRTDQTDFTDLVNLCFE